MKTLFKYFAAIGLAAATVACVNEEPKIDPTPEPPVDGRDVGTLVLDGSFGLVVESRNEEIDNTPGAGTRANGNTDVDTYTVKILNADKGSEEVASFLYGERPTEPIELPVGNYVLKVFSADTPDAAWEGAADTPTYGIEKAFRISKGQCTELGTLTCRPLSVKVTVAYRQSLYELLSADTEADVVLSGVHNLVFAKDEKKAGYLRPLHTGADKENDLVLYLTTVYEGKQITRQPLKVTNNAKAGEWRKITIYLENGESGSVIINAEIETWVNGETIDVDVQQLATIGEATIPDIDDPDAPKVVWSKSDEPIRDKVVLTDDSYNEDGYYLGDANVTIHAKDPMQRFMLEVESDNADVKTLLEENELTGEVDLFTVSGKARSRLRLWGFPTMNLNVTDRTFDLAPLVKVIFDYEGTHTFRMTVTDERNRRSTTELIFEVNKSGGADPNIRWIGNDIDQRHDVVDGLQVEIRITATKGIRSLMVEIEGALGEGLPSVQIPSKFDLVDPEATQAGLSTILGPFNEATGVGFGFPVGDDVRNQTSILFPITTFMPLMGSFKGDTDFKLTVTDNEGNTIAKTVMLHVN
ncbi:DUF4493 domain-containing protein [uncultured Alistipes sp.]|uniref:DUF4493 domain-containing protein n=1 Tax=uncultured Alistipes sp. TaxID=538949 RepID=UPI002622CB76|nr:DUF4493 domain-containing protein [uncultured Alistipes sp.]